MDCLREQGVNSVITGDPKTTTNDYAQLYAEEKKKTSDKIITRVKKG